MKNAKSGREIVLVEINSIKYLEEVRVAGVDEAVKYESTFVHLILFGLDIG